ncbi:ABC transporter permease [Brevibacillus sp. AY1]|uniref:ABC transporter permease n=1 Tax=Brevibacillus sp. AY1 TaxID=2807621 RepID=UPI0024586C94|nr:ABC transporter permease [Brevibacillus sp. AY1]MDH4619771.1 ABC transporter permease [Brevibacillus sp. AY1]
MAMLQMILRKMLNNRWLVGSLLLGLVVAVGLMSSIPAFTNGVLQRLFVKDMEEYQQVVKSFPGGLLVSINQDFGAQDGAIVLAHLKNVMENEIIPSLSTPLLDQVTVLRSLPFQSVLQDQITSSPETAILYSFTNLDQHITLIDGHLPAAEPVDGVLEALVTEKGLMERKMVLGNIYELTTTHADVAAIRIKPVGVFKEKEGNDPYWFARSAEYNKGFILHEELFRKTFLEENNLVLAIRYYLAFQYQEFQFIDKEKLMSVVPELEENLVQFGLKKSDLSIQFPVSSITQKYDEQNQHFRNILWSLYVPIIIMLAIYLVMVSGLIVERQRTEIAVLGSRGAGRGQIFGIYFVEIIILGLLALLIGPFVGIQLSKILGISNGFLQFVDRTGIEAQMNGEVLIYAAWTVLGCMSLLLISIFFATRQNIVTHKQNAARVTGQAMWHRLFLDVILLLISWYGWYSYQNMIENAEKAAEDSVPMSVDVLLFFIPVLFSLGLGLLCLRIYPWLLHGIYWLGRRFWPISVHTTLVQVGRASRQYQFLMLFVTITVAIGMFSASTARTINLNAEEQIFYQNGTDIRLMVDWINDKPVVFLHRNPAMQEGSPGPESPKPPIQYVEPDFLPFQQLPGVEHATRVFVHQMAEASEGRQSVKEVTLMGIDPKEFGQTIWWKQGLLPHHIHDYLNLLGKEPKALLISRTLADKLKVKEGDTIMVGWKNIRPVEMIVYAIVDYWPGWSPVGKDSIYSSKQKEKYQMVANLPYIQSKLHMEPYQVWLNLQAEASSEALYEGLIQNDTRPTFLSNARQLLIETKNSAFYLGVNGSLTLGFLLSMLITFIGYVMYWVLTLGARKLQYGVFRAMGMSFGSLVRIIAWEQFFTFGVAFVMGVAAGKLANMLFLPALKLYLHAEKQIPPFTITSSAQDEWLIYSFVAITLVVGIAIVGVILSRMQIHQAVKLGED